MIVARGKLDDPKNKIQFEGHYDVFRNIQFPRATITAKCPRFNALY